jgi:hypothetical protein
MFAAGEQTALVATFISPSAAAWAESFAPGERSTNFFRSEREQTRDSVDLFAYGERGAVRPDLAALAWLERA